MSSLSNSTFTIASLAVCLALSACSNSPSESELKTAVEHKMRTDFEAMERRVGNQAMPPKPELKSVRKIACTADGDKAFRCNVELEVNHGGTIAKGTASMRFVRNGEEWVASN